MGLLDNTLYSIEMIKVKPTDLQLDDLMNEFDIINELKMPPLTNMSSFPKFDQKIHTSIEEFEMSSNHIVNKFKESADPNDEAHNNFNDMFCGLLQDMTHNMKQSDISNGISMMDMLKFAMPSMEKFTKEITQSQTGNMDMLNYFAKSLSNMNKNNIPK
jgi:hypothetical protein